MPTQQEFTQEKARDYATQLSSVLGTQVDAVTEGTVLSSDPTRGQLDSAHIGQSRPFKGTRLSIAVGDVRAADDTIDTFAALRSKAGLAKEDFPLTLSADKGGSILIDPQGIAELEQKTGKSLAANLSPVQTEMRTAVRGAKAIGQLPSLAKDIGIISGNLDYPDKGIANAQFANRTYILGKDSELIPESMVKGALEFAREIRHDAMDRGIDPAKLRELRDVASLGRDGQGYTDEKAAAYLLAGSMELKKRENGTIGGRFTDSLDFQSPQRTPELMREAAEQIYLQKFGGSQSRNQEQSQETTNSTPQITPDTSGTAARERFMRLRKRAEEVRDARHPPTAAGAIPSADTQKIQDIVEARCGNIQRALAEVIHQRELPDKSGLRFEKGEEMAMAQLDQLRTASLRCDAVGKDFDHFNLGPNPFVDTPGGAGKQR